MTVKPVDRFAQGAGVVFTVAFVVLIIVLVSSLLRGFGGEPAWLQLVAMVFLLVLFALLGWLYGGQALSVLELENDGVRRTGPTAWNVPGEELRRIEVLHEEDRAYLRFAVSDEAARRSGVRRAIGYAAWTQRRLSTPSSIVVRIRPAEVKRITWFLHAGPSS